MNGHPVGRHADGPVAGSVEESPLIERGRLDESQFSRFIDRATDWLEHTMLQVFLESGWAPLPFAYVTKVHSVFGQIAGSPVPGDPPRQLQERNRFAQLVPFHEHAAWALFKGAGHVLLGTRWRPTTTDGDDPFDNGGTPEADARAQADSWVTMLAFVKRQLRP